MTKRKYEKVDEITHCALESELAKFKSFFDERMIKSLDILSSLDGEMLSKYRERHNEDVQATFIASVAINVMADSLSNLQKATGIKKEAYLKHIMGAL